MRVMPETRVSLILRLADPSEVQAWEEFSSLYTPAIYNLARQRGLAPADAEDVTQDVLIALAGAVAKWKPDPDRARFRTWLVRIARNVIVDFFERRKRQVNSVSSAIGFDNDIAASPIDVSGSIDHELNQEYQKSLLHVAAERIKQRVDSKTWQAFYLTAIDQQKPIDVASHLSMPIGSVYVARSRVTRLLREEVNRLSQEWDSQANGKSLLGQDSK